MRLLHDLPDEEAEQTLLPAAVCLDLTGILLEDAVDASGPSSPASETGSLLDERLGRESRNRASSCIASSNALRGMALPPLHELRQLAGGHGGRVETGTDDAFGDDVRRLDGARARYEGLVPEPVESPC